MIKPVTFLNILFVVVIYLIGVVYGSFLLSIVIAALLTIATSKSYSFLLKRLKNPIAVSSILTASLMFILFGPMIYFAFQVILHANSFDPNVLEKIKILIVKYIATTQADEQFKEFLINSIYSLKYEIYIDKFDAALAKFGQDSLTFLANVVVILVFYFFANLYGRKILGFIKRVLPLKTNDSEQIFNEVSQVMSVVMYSTIINATLQGLLFSFVMLYIGYDALFWGIAFGFCSLIPVVGASLLWAPISLYEFSNGNSANAIIVIVYTVVAISIIADTFVKPVIIDFINRKIARTKTEINSLLIFFAVIAGMSAFGFWGIILGPAATALFVSILKIYDKLKIEEEIANRKALKLEEISAASSSQI
jgi:predicted PurR-regulated permease PerM